jgi:hypothetical protein
VRIAFTFPGKCGEGFSEAGDSLTDRHVGPAKQVGDLAAAHAEIDQQRNHAT